MRRSILPAAIYVLLVFLSGAVVGAFSYRLYMMNSVSAEENRRSSSPDDWRRQYVEEMRTRLSLSDDQVGRLHEILDYTKQRYRELHDRQKPEMRAVQDGQVQRIRAMLSESQQAEYAKLREEREARRKLRSRP